MNTKQFVEQMKQKLLMLAKEHGIKFVVYIILMDLLDDYLIPSALTYFGHPVLGGIAFFGDLDWLTWPLYFVAVNAWKAMKVTRVIA